MARIGAGVIGAGFMGRAHVEALRRLGRVDVVALASSSPARAAARARALHIPRVAETYQAVLQDPDVTVLHNCTPNHLHHEVTAAALAAGKHVVSEKPLAIDSRQTADLVARAAAAGVVHAVNFNYRYYPLVQHARAMIDAGELGEVRLIHGSYLQDWLLYEADYNWRVDPVQGGPSRALADIGSHWCDLVQHVSGLRMMAVLADVATLLPARRRARERRETFAGTGEASETVPVTTEDYGAVLFRFTGGARGALVVSQVSAGHKNRLSFEVNGSRRSLAWNQEEPNVLWVGERDRANWQLLKDPALLHEAARPYAHYPGGHNEAYPDALLNLLGNVYARILEGAPTDYPTFVDGHRAVQVIETILRSHKEERWVEVERYS